MKPANKILGRTMRYYAALMALYVILALALPINRTVLLQYHLSLEAYRSLVVLVLIPLIAILFAAFYGYAKLQQYTASIHSTKEGRHFAVLAKGCQWLAWGLAVSSIISLVVGGIAADSPGFTGASVIIGNYCWVVFTLVAFSCISSASRALTTDAKMRIDISGIRIIILSFVVLGVAFCYLIFRRLDIQSITSTHNPYYLPVWLMILTVIVPALYTWFIGFLAVYELTTYAQQARGVLYRQALQLLAGGFAAVITSFIVIQYLRTVDTPAAHPSLGSMLLIINLVYLLIAAGFIAISAGARRLKRIEEV